MNLYSSKLSLAHIIMVAIMSSFSVSHSSYGQNKVVVIPLGSDSTCNYRQSDLESLTGFFKTIDSVCLANEKVISGGYEIGSYNTTNDCRVIESYPDANNNRWVVRWGMPASDECSGATASTFAICCR